MRRHVRASSAGSIQRFGTGRGLAGLVCLCVFGLVAFLGSSASPALAVDNCPNAILRQLNNSGNLPDCRAYELVSPANAGAHRLTATGLANSPAPFEDLLTTTNGDTVEFHSDDGALPGQPEPASRIATWRREGATAGRPRSPAPPPR